VPFGWGFGFGGGQRLNQDEYEFQFFCGIDQQLLVASSIFILRGLSFSLHGERRLIFMELLHTLAIFPGAALRNARWRSGVYISMIKKAAERDLAADVLKPVVARELAATIRRALDKTKNST